MKTPASGSGPGQHRPGPVVSNRPPCFPAPFTPAADHHCRELACHALAYAVAVERRYRGLPPLPDAPVPFTLTAKAGVLLDGSGQGDPEPLSARQEVPA